MEWPLRKIVRREIQNGQTVTVLVCKHATLMRPLSRYSRFMPCLRCHERVIALRWRHEKASR
jgi:hypothetical protein